MKNAYKRSHKIPLAWWVWALVGWCSAGCGTIDLPPSSDERPKTTASSESQHAEESIASDGGESPLSPETSPTEPTLPPETALEEPMHTPDLDAKPQLAWHKRFGGEIVDGGQMIHAERDSSGNIYVIGRFYGTLQIGAFRATTKGGQDIFVARFDQIGRCVWLKTWGSPQDDEGRGIAIDPQGDLYIVGHFTGPMAMDSHALTPQSKQGGDGLIARLDPAGNVLWFRQIAEEVLTPPYKQTQMFSHAHIAFHPTGHLLVAGTKETHYRDMGTSQKVGIFLHAYEKDGKDLWKREWYGAHGEEIKRLAVNPQGQIGFVANSHRGISIDTFTGYRQYIVLLDAQGKLLWGRRLPDNANTTHAHHIALDTKGNLFLLGDGDGKSLDKDVPSSGERKGFLVKFDGVGNILWMKEFASSQEVQFRGLGLDTFGHPFVMGAFRKEVTLDTQTATLPTIGSIAGSGFFLCKFNDEGRLQWHKTYPTKIDTTTTTDPTARFFPAISRLDGVIWIAPFLESLSLQPNRFLYSPSSVGSYTQTNSAFFMAHIQTHGTTGWSHASGNGNGPWKTQGLQRDAQGNLYTLGSFYGSSPLLPITRTSPQGGHPQMALIKYAPDGKQLWERTFQATGLESSPLLLTTSTRHLYVVGHTTSDITIEDTRLSVPKDILTLFVAQFSLEGQLVSLKSFGGSADQKVTAVSADPQGNLFLAGPVHAGMQIGPHAPPLETDQIAAYIAKISTDGTVAWLHLVQGTKAIGYGTCAIGSIQADAQGDVYITGQAFVKTLQLGTLVLTPQTRNGRLQPLGFVAKLSREGKALWYRSHWSASDLPNHSPSLALHENNLYLAGIYSHHAVFGETALPGHAYAGFLARLNTQGDPQWAQSITMDATYPQEAVRSLVVAPDGGVYLTGNFRKQIQFSSRLGLTPPAQVEPAIYGAQHSFLVRYTSQGDAVWALAFDHPRAQEHMIDLSSMVADHTGRITLAGSVKAFQASTPTPDHALQIDQTILSFETNNADFLLSFTPPAP